MVNPFPSVPSTRSRPHLTLSDFQRLSARDSFFYTGRYYDDETSVEPVGPEGLAHYEQGGQHYIFSANEKSGTMTVMQVTSTGGQ